MGFRLGFCSRTGSAVAVAVPAGPGTPVLAGRWSVDLTDPDTPWQLFHAAAELPLAQAETLVRTGVAAVTEVATRRLRELRSELAGPVTAVGVVVGDHPVPDSLAKILAAHTMMHAAEGQLYRDALLDAAAACRLPAHGLPKGRAAALLAGELAGAVAALGAGVGPPWRKEHKLAAVAALAAGT
jgi:hypothetical protein